MPEVSSARLYYRVSKDPGPRGCAYENHPTSSLARIRPPRGQAGGVAQQLRCVSRLIHLAKSSSRYSSRAVPVFQISSPRSQIEAFSVAVGVHFASKSDLIRAKAAEWRSIVTCSLLPRACFSPRFNPHFFPSYHPLYHCTYLPLAPPTSVACSRSQIKLTPSSLQLPP